MKKCRNFCALVGIAALALGTCIANAQLSFVEVSDVAGLPDDCMRSATMIDWDGDGDDDLFMTRLSDNKLLYYEDDSGVYVDRSYSVSVYCPFRLLTLRVFDYDLDGNYDVFGVDDETNALRLFHNNITSFTEVTLNAPPYAGTIDPRGSPPQIYDFDRDGDPDIIYHGGSVPGFDLILLRNDQEVFVPEILYDVPEEHFAGDFLVADFNNDGFPDIIRSSMIEAGCLNWGYRTSPYMLLLNDHGNGVAYSASSGIPDMNIRGNLGSFDYNNDGLADIFSGTPDYICNGGEEKNWLVRNNGNLTFADVSSPSMNCGSNYYDYFRPADVDRDGDLDYFQQVETWTHSRLFLSNNDGTFEEVSDAMGIDYSAGYSGTAESFWTDYDQDGDLDLLRFVRRTNPPGVGPSLLYRNDVVGGNWLAIRARPQGSISSLYGLRVLAYCGDKVMSRWIDNYSTKMAHFGLGQNTTVDSLAVFWTSGQVTTEYGVECNQVLAVFEQRGPLVVADVPDDQGGYLTLAWPRLEEWIFGSDADIATYHIQKQIAGDWVTVASLASTGADTFSTVIETSDVFIVGDPPPYANYRVAAETVNGGIFYPSEVDSGYSIDNLPPSQPEAQLLEFDGIVVILWETPTSPTSTRPASTAGTTPNFIRENRSRARRNWLPRPVQRDGLLPRSVLRHPRQPQPVQRGSASGPDGGRRKRCRRSWRFCLLPEPVQSPDHAELHASGGRSRRRGNLCRTGKEVARVVDESLTAGPHTVDWDGRDAYGASMPSGTYFCRLTTQWGVETRDVVAAMTT